MLVLAMGEDGVKDEQQHGPVSWLTKFTTESKTKKKESTATRFELARAEPSRFRIYLLNHSDTLPLTKGRTELLHPRGLCVVG